MKRFELITIESYLDFPRAEQWVKARSGELSYGQIDPGPVTGWLNTDAGPRRVLIGDAIAHSHEMGFTVASFEIIEHKRLPESGIQSPIDFSDLRARQQVARDPWGKL